MFSPTSSWGLTCIFLVYLVVLPLLSVFWCHCPLLAIPSLFLSLSLPFSPKMEEQLVAGSLVFSLRYLAVSWVLESMHVINWAHLSVRCFHGEYWPNWRCFTCSHKNVDHYISFAFNSGSFVIYFVIKILYFASNWKSNCEKWYSS